MCRVYKHVQYAYALCVICYISYIYKIYIYVCNVKHIYIIYIHYMLHTFVCDTLNYESSLFKISLHFAKICAAGTHISDIFYILVFLN